MNRFKNDPSFFITQFVVGGINVIRPYLGSVRDWISQKHTKYRKAVVSVTDLIRI